MSSLVEILEKAGNRIKNAKRVTGAKKKSASHEDLAAAVKALMNSPHLDDAAKKKLAGIHKEAKGNIEKEKFREQAKEHREKYGELELGKKGKEAAEKKAKLKQDIQEHVDEQGATKIKEVGGEIPEQEMRSKAAGKLTGSVRRRMATGEDVAIRDKKYGQKLDLERQIKEGVQKEREKRAPEVIKISGAPEIPDEHKDHPNIKKLLDMRSKATVQRHVDVIDKGINDMIAHLNEPKKDQAG